MILARVPGLSMLKSCQARWLSRDLVAGLILTALLVPQGMAYVELPGLPPITGRYTSILCLLGYALFGPSRIWSWDRTRRSDR
jgi:MFS superfamily sulfate permease-like transporter